MKKEGPGYLARIVLAQQKGLLPPGGYIPVDVQHDSWCKVYKGKECNCFPNVILHQDGKKKLIREDGTIGAVVGRES